MMTSMHVVASVDLDCPPATALAVLGDLGRYPEWLDIVHRARPVDLDPGDPGPAWLVDLRASLGPLARSKRLRMVRSVHTDTAIRFERRELDGREHSAWELAADIVAAPAGTSVTMALDYGGGLLDGLVERLLQREIEAARGRLRALTA